MSHNSRIEELRRRVQLDPASIAFAALAEEYRRAGQFADAIAVCEAGLQRHPAYISARVTLGRSLLALGRFDEARHELEHVLRAAPENLAAIRALAEIHARVGDSPHASPSDARDVGDSQPVTPPPAPVSVAPPASVPAPPPPSAPAHVAAPPVEPMRVAAPPPLSPPPAPRPVVPPPVHVSPQPPAPPARVPHPDEAALPALEAFLAAILAAKAPVRQPFE